MHEPRLTVNYIKRNRRYPRCGYRRKNFSNSRIKTQKIQEFEGRGSALRNESRSGTVVAVRIVEPVRAELDPADVEAEDRGAIEANNGIRIVELVTRAVDPKIIVVHEPFRMGQDHDANGERAEAELVDQKDFTSTTHRATAVPDAELSRNDEDVRTALRLREICPELLQLSRLAETLLVELAVTVVVELAVAGPLDSVEHLLKCRAVSGTEDGLVLDPVGDREPTLGTDWQRDLAFLDLREQVEVGETDAGEQFAQTVALLGQTLGGVTGQIAVGRADLFVLELVGVRQLGESENGRGMDAADEVGVTLHALGTFLAEIVGIGISLYRLLGSIGGHAGKQLDLAVGGRFTSKRRHDVSSYSSARFALVCVLPRLRRAS